MPDYRVAPADPGVTPLQDCYAALAPLLTWSYEDNLTGWGALLSGVDEAPQYAALARATDLDGLPPAYLDVGDLDLFPDEVVSYATALQNAGVPTELHVVSGGPHAYDLLTPETQVTRDVIAERVRPLRAL